MATAREQLAMRLLAREEIKQRIVAYMNAVSRRNWDAATAVFWPEAQLDYGTPGAVNVDDNIALLRAGVDRMTSCSTLLDMQSVIEVDEAIAHSRSMSLTTHLPADKTDVRARNSIVEYEDDWQQRDGIWRITRRICHHRSKGWFSLTPR
jgi:hypothetical protein